jgi:hypothetical protein
MLDHMKEVLGIFLENLISPGVARTGEVDEVVKSLKQALVRYVVDRHAAPKDVIARHLGKSDRWLYRQLEDSELAKKEPLSPPHEGHRLLYEVLKFYHARSPQSGTVTECAKHLRQIQWKISTSELEPLLTLYSGMGYLERLEGEPGKEEASYRALAPTYTVKASGERERLQLLSRHTGAILPIALSYLRGDEVARFSMSEGEVLEKHLKAAVRDIWQYQVTRLNQAVEASIQEDPDERGQKVKYRALFLCGLGPFYDDPKGGAS